jgi:hypothetical protein
MTATIFLADSRRDLAAKVFAEVVIGHGIVGSPEQGLQFAILKIELCLFVALFLQPDRQDTVLLLFSANRISEIGILGFDLVVCLDAFIVNAVAVL